MIAVANIIRIVTTDPERRDALETVEYDSDAVVIRERPEGIVIEPKKTWENELGFLRLFYPWAEVRQIKEFKRA